MPHFPSYKWGEQEHSKTKRLVWDYQLIGYGDRIWAQTCLIAKPFVHNWPPMQRANWKKGTGHFRFLDGRFNKQGDLNWISTRLIWSSCKTIDLLPCLPESWKFIGRLYLDCHIVQMVSTAHCSLKAASWKMRPTVRTVARVLLLRAGDRVRRLPCPLLDHRSAPFNDLLLKKHKSQCKEGLV